MLMGSADKKAKKLSLESVKLSVHWRGLYVKYGEKQALAPCSGDVRAGQVTALMGATGAGKTTLLNAIARRGPLSGGELWYGEGFGWSKSMKRYVAFIEQDDACFENLTVWETLNFSSRLRLPDASRAAKAAKVDEVIRLLRLEPCKDTRVGSAMVRGVSGGERKRLMVCQEMLTEPRLLCCDEPTSGLDSTTAAVVMEALRDLALAKEVAIVASIHQPSSRIFMLFDELFVLDRGGCAYRGGTKGAGDAFAMAPFDLPCPPEYSAPDWIMEIGVSGQLRSVVAEEDLEDEVKVKRAAALVARYGVDTLPRRVSDDGGDKALTYIRAESSAANYAVPYSEQVAVLFQRTWKQVRPMCFDKNAVALHVGNSLIAGTMWFNLGYNEDDIWPRVTVAFAIPIAWVFFPLLDSLAVVPKNEVMLKKELSTNSYALFAWYGVTTTTLLAPMVCQSLLHVSIIFALTNVSNLFIVWFALYALVVLAMLTFQSVGLFFSAAVPPANLSTVSMLYVTFCFLFTGIFVPLEDTPIPWIRFINPMYYIMCLGMYIVFGLNDRTFSCTRNLDDEGTSFYEDCVAPGANRRISQKAILESYDVHKITPEACVFSLVIYMAIARFIAYVILKHRMTIHLTATAKLTDNNENDATAAAAATENQSVGNLSMAHAPPPTTTRGADDDDVSPSPGADGETKAGPQPHRSKSGVLPSDNPDANDNV